MFHPAAFILHPLLVVFFLPTPVVAQVELAKATNLEKLNTDADETDPYPADNLTLLYAGRKNNSFEIYVAKRIAATQPWLAGRPHVTLIDADAMGPVYYKGFLYFAANISPEVKRKNFDLYRRLDDLSKKSDQGAPIPIRTVSDPEDEARPWITTGGGEYFFSRKLADGWTQFVAVGPTPGPIGKAKEVGFPAGFSHGTLNAAGTTMYLQGPVDKDRVGVFRATRARVGGAWTKPEPVVKLNHPEAKRGDMSPVLSIDGTRLYFSSDRPGGKGGLDLWVVPIASLK